mmetsp:Transcript_57443/g.171365  ORF Transcript_57443/g.171365 Transcript_57443/m.171365 type:complete len:243 (-) Transcript_57443:516-1244(-)
MQNPFVDTDNNAINNLSLHPFLKGNGPHKLIHPLDATSSALEGSRRRGWVGQRFSGLGVLFEWNKVPLVAPETRAEAHHPLIDRSASFWVFSDRVSDRNHILGVLCNTTVVSRQQHCPLRQGNEHRVVKPQFHRNFVTIIASGLDISLKSPQDRRVPLRPESCRLKVGREPHHQHIRIFVRRSEGLWIGAALSNEFRIVEGVPERRIGEAGTNFVRRGDTVLQARNSPEVGQERHVSNGHGW